MIHASRPRGVILFDGVCNLCNAFVNFVIDRDPHGYFRFGALQSAVGQDLLKRHHVPGAALRTLILIEDGAVYTESTAALRILRRLGGAWSLLHALRVIPPLLRDPVYRLIGRNRYRWFGRRAQCRLPEPGVEERFLI